MHKNLLTICPDSNSKPFNRRSFLKISTLTVSACIFPLFIPERVSAKISPNRHLHFINSNTGENLDVTYWTKNRYIPEALEDIDYILRDYRTDEIKKIHPQLLNYLYAISTSLKLSGRNPFHIISGYRSPKTNAKLRRKNKGVARNSYHVKGKAIDIRLPRYRTSALRKAAMRLRMGGVGYYPKSRFIHIDTGKVRFW